MGLHHSQKCLCGCCSPRTGTLIIGWFNFMVCFIPLVALILYGMSGAQGLDNFIYGVSGMSRNRFSYLKTAAGIVDEDRLIKNVRDIESEKPGSKNMNNLINRLEDTIEWVSEKPYWQENTYSSRYWDNNITLTMSLGDINHYLRHFVHRILFVVGGDSIFFLIIIGTILGIGVTFNGLLIIGVYTDGVSPIAVWMTHWILNTIFDTSLLICGVIYSEDSFYPTLQAIRISFALCCLYIVNKHYKSLYKPKNNVIDVFTISKTISAA
ncbi:hypothetical protein LSTR_LSTR007782 [Laodelphax striatellus]|uniref:Uncharacterized protein n=1 Tax=Laodelphax striatellus TaxID=195883 RepID=A0A482XS40_LAOST|nr:hypothetical protein LSTR_LSTR007782 [Laodelphax striatellus]